MRSLLDQIDNLTDLHLKEIYIYKELTFERVTYNVNS